jgi:acetyl esterase/lipase
MRSDANLKTPMFQAHGVDDNVVNFKFGEMSYHALKKLGVNVEFHRYEGMAHDAFPEELKHLRQWIKERLDTSEVVDEVQTREAKESDKPTADEAGNKPKGNV